MKDTLNADGTPGGDGNGNGQGNGQGQGQGQQAGMTREQLQDLLNENQAPLTEALQAIAQRVQALQAAPNQGGGRGQGQGNQGGRGGAGAGGGEADEFVSELLNDGQAVIDRRAREIASKVIAEKLGPYFQAKLPAEREANLAANRARVDSTYGDGFFDEHVAPMLLGRDGKSGVLGTQSLGDQSLPQVVEATVDGVLGRLLANPETRSKMLEGLSKTETARQAQRRTLNPPRQLGPGLPRGTKPTEVEIPDPIRDSLSDMKRSGIDFSEADLLDALSRGNSAEDWDDAFKKPNSGKAA